MKLIFSVVLLATSLTAVAGELLYPASLIPEELKKGANAVVRENKMVYTILAASHARVHCLFAITILNTRGDDQASNVQMYDKLTKLTLFTASVYDASGKLIRKLKSAEIRDQSVFDGSSLFNDDRIKYADLEQSIYPYTVVFEYEKEYRFLYVIDRFDLVPDEMISVQKASYQLIFPISLAPRYKMINLTQAPIKTNVDNNNQSLLWEFTNVPPITYEPMGTGWRGVKPSISGAPTKFEYEGYAGVMTTWDDYGKWISSLMVGRDLLPAETKDKIKTLAKNARTIEEKSRIVYDFVQNRSRYVGIQLGIGGMQPFSADVVDKTGFGDCKALSNYTIALLREVGVNANYVLISAGNSFTVLDPKFPSHQFNHATVCVPNGIDSLWLECTSQTAPFGFAGHFTGDRDAVAITENGAKVVHTTIYPAELNRKVVTAKVTIDAGGNALSNVTSRFSGLSYEYEGLSFMLGADHEKQKKWVEKYTEVPNFDLREFSMTNKRDKIPTATVTESLVLNRLANVSGKRMFLTPNLMSRSSYVPNAIENRKTNIVVYSGHVSIDTIQYEIPEALYPEFLPQPIDITSRFGDYKASFKLEQGKIIYTRKVLMKKGTYPAETYNELIDFYKKISKADNTKIVFLNRT